MRNYETTAKKICTYCRNRHQTLEAEPYCIETCLYNEKKQLRDGGSAFKIDNKNKPTMVYKAYGQVIRSLVA